MCKHICTPTYTHTHTYAHKHTHIPMKAHDPTTILPSSSTSNNIKCPKLQTASEEPSSGEGESGGHSERVSVGGGVMAVKAEAGDRRGEEGRGTEGMRGVDREGRREEEGLDIEFEIPHDNVTDNNVAFYYNRLFPFDGLVRWLTYCNDPSKTAGICNDPEFFTKREMSFTLMKGDIYIRWQAFRDAEVLKKSVFQMKPHKLDIGAVYSIPIADKNTSTKLCKPEQKEMVFDIDMDDYDDIRTCCSEKTVCKKCWKFLTLATNLIEAVLTEDFNFHHVLWVFSGRRGIHGWVCDSHARKLPSDGRAAIADYINLITGGANQKKKVSLWAHHGRGFHPMIDRAYGICRRFFPTLLMEQDFFNPKYSHLDKLSDYLPNTAVGGNAPVQTEFQLWVEKLKSREGVGGNKHMSMLVWNKLRVLGGIAREGGDRVVQGDRSSVMESPSLWDVRKEGEYEKEIRATPQWLKEIVFSYSYPRLDINVSKDIGHLLKSPFCVHQKTGRICVPIDPAEAQQFNPALVPTLSLLRKQYDSSVSLNDSKVSIEEHVYKTSLGKYVRFFAETFLGQLEKETRREIQDFKSKFAVVGPDKVGLNTW
eukprot:GHVQ01000676.1.p1 GENE.GHVQ01000676.1~~GHVQ01000676.1.p1  ORF type:complete len:593 (-),score=84.78 GHVQ01000676.1:314-2092(-)